MDILYSYSAHYNKLPSIAAIKSPWYTILRYVSNTSYLKKTVQSIHCRSFWSKHWEGCPNSNTESLLRHVYYLWVCKDFEPFRPSLAPHREVSTCNQNSHMLAHAHTHSHTQTHADLPAWLVWGMLLLGKDLWWQTEGNETQRDIYCHCQSLLSLRGGQQEILAENWVLSLIRNAKTTQSFPHATRVLRSQTLRSVSKHQTPVRQEKMSNSQKTSDVPIVLPQHFAHGALFN